MPGLDRCFAHAPELEAKRHAGRVEGGINKRTENRALKRLPGTLKDSLAVLYRTLHGLESGDIEPARATAIAAVSRAIVNTFEAGQVEARLDALETRVNATTAGTGKRDHAA
jgi:hypothetical protein